MNDERLCVAVIQMQSGPDVAQNLAAVRQHVDEAASRGAELVVLPENFAFFGAEEERRALAEAIGEGPISQAVAELARERSLVLVAGGMPERSGDEQRPFNTAAVFGPNGAVLASYRKVHLFDVELGASQVYAESASTSAGDRAVVFDYEGVRVGLAICYDLRFPALFEALSHAGAELLCVSAAFTERTGMAHWETLLRARAIEQSAYVAAAAQWGTHPGGRQTYGHSSVIDPWGAVLSQHGEGAGVALATLDRAYLEQVRRRLPCLRHRRDIAPVQG